MKRMDAKKSRQSSLAQRFRASIRGIATRNRAFQALGWSATFATALLTAGCSRQHYRQKVDNEAYYLLDEKAYQSCEENRALYRIELDPSSRMFDPFNPDRPPMPEDDPQANRFMKKVDGKKGYPLWEGNGRTNTTENPDWVNQLPLDERGVLVLDLNNAVRLALVHSPNYQRSLEELYLSALDVSSERFLLDSQFFGGWQSDFERLGTRLPIPSGTTEIGTGTFNAATGGRRGSGLFMRKTFATGADLLVNFANSITWQLAGPGDPLTNSSLLDFAFIQPLLRQGGRDVVLERLTLAERTLLANVRAFERYRRAFYVQIATGRNPDTQPRRRGGAFGGAGLAGFDVLGSVFSNAGGGGGFATGGGGVPGAGGFLGLLQDQLNISNQQETIIRLQDLYLQLQDNYRELLLTMPATQTEIPGEQIQVAQSLQEVYTTQTQLLNQRATYEQSLDQFKSTLGLPPYLCVEINDPLLDQFKLISQDLRDRRTQIAGFRARVGESNSALLDITTVVEDPTTGESYRTVESSEELKTGLGLVREDLEPLIDIVQIILEEDVPRVREDLTRLRGNIPIRKEQLSQLKEVAETEKGMICSLLPLGEFNTTFLDGVGLDELPDELDAELNRLVETLESQAAEYAEVMETTTRVAESLDDFASDRERFMIISEEIVLASQDLIATINENILAIQLVQGRARTESALLPEVEISPRDALEIARTNRRDWLNNRANLVNAWRAIEVVADDLESVLDLTITGSVGNVGRNPLALHSSTGRLRAGLAWDAPITRIQERNNYRQVLIQYQQARRSYYQYEDGVWASLRATLRQIRQNQLSFEIQRYAVQNAALQIGVNEDIRQINETLGQASGPTAARDAVQGLQSFLGTQSQLIGVFVNYEAIRRGLDLDLGTMEVDAEGLWIDPGPIRSDTVGGALGDAIMEYGLTEGEMLLRDQIQVIDDQPIEVAPSDQLPPANAPGNGNGGNAIPAPDGPGEIVLPDPVDGARNDAPKRRKPTVRTAELPKLIGGYDASIFKSSRR